jgi:hypothetical protein
MRFRQSLQGAGNALKVNGISRRAGSKVGLVYNLAANVATSRIDAFRYPSGNFSIAKNLGNLAPSFATIKKIARNSPLLGLAAVGSGKRTLEGADGKLALIRSSSRLREASKKLFWSSCVESMG